MGIYVPLTRTTDQVAYCFADDPCVTAPVGEVGWVPASECTTITIGSDKADVVVVRPPTVGEHVEAQDAGGARSKAVLLARKCIVSINGKKGRRDIDAWVDSVALYQDTALILLWVVLRALARGVDPRSAQRRAVENVDESESDAEDAEGD